MTLDAFANYVLLAYLIWHTTNIWCRAMLTWWRLYRSRREWQEILKLPFDERLVAMESHIRKWDRTNAH